MKPVLAALALTACAAAATPALAQYDGHAPRRVAPSYDVDSTGSVNRAPWEQPWQYDTGSDNDKRPELAPYQQGGGQQTGGPARNLIPGDNLHFAPR